ncbi:flavin-containing monooxygenase [Pseudorhodoferax soli]|uniref:Cation diffusion facilitator CzcD-associated flavoprotein CzcO n=1 Tax=Pseudorhodoferax soli TaxID=545864 RepID=A0A368X7H5_9BURK|nr:NAD(P)-binding domain-containing protein [Pseudorhodoferax soli]RCW63639.1 cation diffusion facilitator CzcD-associated flavoprotein CzcO [Pseudorhodoferax soli]
MTTTASLSVCIIGAGSSGMAAAKALAARGVAFEGFEIGSDIGGMWRYENDNGLSSAYRSLHIDTSRGNLGYPDHPIPSTYPDFLSHEEVLEWLESYAQRFDLKRHFRFGCKVEQVAPADDGSWCVRLADGSERRFRAVIVANGHLWDPRVASFAGRFDGEQLHAHHYRTAAPFAGQNVLVVGIGNSAVDIAVDVCKSARRTFLSTRRSAWIMPKYIMGIPVDRWSGFFARKLHLPTPVSRTLVRWLAVLAVGDQRRFGVPRPQHAIWREHTTLSQELLPYCGHGWIRMKPNVQELRGTQVAFDDGSVETIDAIILATGYRTSFPFLDPQLFQVNEDIPALYRRMAPPQLPGLYFLGLVQPVGPTIPLVEVQSRWLSALLGGAMHLPPAATQSREIDRHAQGVRARYVGTARYALEVDARSYARQLLQDMQRGEASV